MVSYHLSPYVHFIESHLIPNASQYGVFHQLTGEVLQPNQRVRSLLFAAGVGSQISFNYPDLEHLGEDGVQICKLIEEEFLVPQGHDLLSSFLGRIVVRPLQNPAVAYRSDNRSMLLVRLSMSGRAYSPRRDELPTIIEEEIPPLATEIFMLADGTKTLREIFERQGRAGGENLLEDRGFRDAVEFLSDQQRQLIKLTSQPDDLVDPFKPVNLVPRDLYHSSRWNEQSPVSAEPIIDFHLHGIADASWEFDQIEPTVNHCFRFPSEVLGGLDYGSRFCLSTLCSEVLPLLGQSDRLEVLEVGGGTGSFARSFILQARELTAARHNGIDCNYHILDLSPALIQSQRGLLSQLLPVTNHFQQDATAFDLPGHKFDLIIANEVIADFPVASVWRNSNDESASEAHQRTARRTAWLGDGAGYVEKYNLADETAPDSFLVNAGAFRFIERAWEHLAPGGTLIISEYGTAQSYPAQSYHLNHEEFSIHFGYLAACAAGVGFDSRLRTLKEFLELDDQVLVLNGREEHISCLNHVLEKFGVRLPYAVITRKEFEERCQGIAQRIGLTGFSFSPLWRGHHFGPRIDDFMVLTMNRPW